MKKIFLSVSLFCITLIAKAQSISISSNGAIADTSAMLDISSHTKGVLIPRLRTSERTSIAMERISTLTNSKELHGSIRFTDLYDEQGNATGRSDDGFKVILCHCFTTKTRCYSNNLQ